MDLKNAVDQIDVWRAREGITHDKPLNEKQIEKFCGDLHKLVDRFPVRPERVAWAKYEESTPKVWKEDARVIPYSGSINEIPAYKYAKAMSEGAKGELFYITDTPAGKLLDNEKLQEAVRKAVGGKNVKVGEEWQDRIFNGQFDGSKRISEKAIGDKLSLNDYVSARLMRTQAHGDVRTLTATALTDRVFGCTEVKELLTNQKVTAINAVPKSVFAEIYLQTGSLDNVHRAVAASSMRISADIRADAHGEGRNSEVLAVDTTTFYKGTGYGGVSVPREKTNVTLGQEYEKAPDYDRQRSSANTAVLDRGIAAFSARVAQQQQRSVAQPVPSVQAMASDRVPPARALER